MSGIYLSEEELDLLAECSLEATRLYVLGLRTRMDIKTGTVGRFSRVSLNGLSDKIRFQPKSGSPRKPFAPSHRQVRTLIDELTSASLCESASTPKEKADRILVLRLTQAKTSELTSFCPETVGQWSVNGRSNNENTDKAVYFQQDKSEIDIEITTEKVAGVGHISENQRYKNDEMITVREEIFASASQPTATAERTDSLADYDKELRSAGYTHSQVLQSVAQLKALKAQGATVEHLRDGIRIAKDRGGVSVAYAAKCAASICRQQKQALATPTASAPKCQKTRRLNDIPSHHAHSPAVPALRSMQDMPVVSSINDWSL